MRQALDDALCAEFPDLFRQRHGDMRETAMCWGFGCGDGWYPLLRHLCLELTATLRVEEQSYQFYAAHAARPSEEHASLPAWIQKDLTDDALAERRAKIDTLRAACPVVMQVKEKFGTLRFYAANATREQQAAISAAERLSGFVCEYCSMMTGTKTYTLYGWHKTLCPACATTQGYLPDEEIPIEE